MNKARLIWGATCMTLAVLLGVLTIVLPENSMMFTVGNTNMPIVPALILGAIGLALLLSAGKVPEVRDPKLEIVYDEEKVALNKRLETIGWGLFLIMLGGFILVPIDVINKGIWSIGVGVIMLGLNAARYYFKIRLSAFTTFLGVVSLISGTAQMLGMEMLGDAAFFIILGAYLLLKPWFEKRQIFGQAGEV